MKARCHCSTRFAEKYTRAPLAFLAPGHAARSRNHTLTSTLQLGVGQFDTLSLHTAQSHMLGRGGSSGGSRRKEDPCNFTLCHFARNFTGSTGKCGPATGGPTASVSAAHHSPALRLATCTLYFRYFWAWSCDGCIFVHKSLAASSPPGNNVGRHLAASQNRICPASKHQSLPADMAHYQATACLVALNR